MCTRLASFGILVALAAAASALTLNTPATAWIENTQQTVTWESIASDPAAFTLSIFKQNDTVVPLALASDVPTASHLYTLAVPKVDPGAGWYLIAANTTDNDIIYAETASFEIEAA